MGGNCPLLSLASLMEYKKAINPKNIIYIHTERNDVLISNSGKKLANLSPGSTIGTSSIRRRSQSPSRFNAMC